MATWTISYRSQLKEGLNMLAEHYQEERLQAEALLSRISTACVQEYFKESTSSVYPNSLGEDWLVYDLPDTLTNFLVGGKNPVMEKVSSNKKVALPGDFIISRLRHYLNEMALVPVLEKSVALSTEYLVFRPVSSVSAHLLLPFSLSKHVRSILKWAQTGNAHPRFASSVFKRIPLPDVLVEHAGVFQDEIDKAIRELEQSQTLMKQANEAISELLRLETLRNIECQYYQTKLSGIVASHRLDAEHFNPKFERLKELLFEAGKVVTLKSSVSFCKRGRQPRYKAEGSKVLNSRHVRVNKVIFVDNRLAELGSSPDQIIRHGDLLINGTGVGTIGRAAPYLENDVAIPDNHITIIRTNDFDTSYLSAYINSEAGQIQVNKHLRGSSGQLELYPTDIEKFLIWKPDKTIQKEIGDLVRASSAKESNAKQILVSARRRVEELIDQAFTDISMASV